MQPHISRVSPTESGPSRQRVEAALPTGEQRPLDASRQPDTYPAHTTRTLLNPAGQAPSASRRVSFDKYAYVSEFSVPTGKKLRPVKASPRAAKQAQPVKNTDHGRFLLSLMRLSAQTGDLSPSRTRVRNDHLHRAQLIEKKLSAKRGDVRASSSSTQAPYPRIWRHRRRARQPSCCYRSRKRPPDT